MLFLGVPILIILLTCVLVGLDLRTKPALDQVSDQPDKSRNDNLTGWLAIVIGTLLLGYLGFKLLAVYAIVVPEAGEIVSGFGTKAPQNTWILLALTLIDIKLPIALGALTFGVIKVRKPIET